LPPLELNRVWHITAPLNLDLLTAAGKRFVGKHDFAAFAANRGKTEGNTVRTIWSLHVRRRGPAIAIEVSGSGFLYKMVRLMVGAMTQVAFEKQNVVKIDNDLKSGSVNGARFAAPGQGLYLVKVWY
jgi:tRNA pseudouridine38-40 synthase